MSKILENIARENFRSSGYIQHPSRERRTPWTFSSPPRSPLQSIDTVRDALERRERAMQRQSAKTGAFFSCLNVFLYRR